MPHPSSPVQNPIRRLTVGLPLTHVALWLCAGFILALSASTQAADTRLLNVSYDVTREFYQDFNQAFVTHWKSQSGHSITVNQSHGGSSKQARSVVDGLEADVVTMNQPLDIDILHERGQLIPKDWSSRLPHDSVPYTSTILFLVRKGNAKGIRDWPDLVRPGVSVIIPNPKTSGNGRYAYLAAWGYAWKKSAGNEEAARRFVSQLFAQVPVLDTGGRAATTTFAQRGIGDVLLTFENEIGLILRELGAGNFEVLAPSQSVVAENPVVWVDKVVARKNTQPLAKAYLEYLFTPVGQELAAKHHFRPVDPVILAKHQAAFRKLDLFTVKEVFGSWADAQKKHFADGGVFDQIFKADKK